MVKLIAITGPDGCGKSRIAKTTSTLLNSWGLSCSVVSIWDSLRLQPLFFKKEAVFAYLDSIPEEERLPFIAHGMRLALEEANKTNIAIIDAYWYKYYLSEILIQKSLVNKIIFKNLPKPAEVFYLNTNLEVICQRKRDYSRYECGGNKASLYNFKSFQKQMHSLWQEHLSKNQNWIKLDGSLEPRVIARNISLRVIISENQESRIYA